VAMWLCGYVAIWLYVPHSPSLPPGGGGGGGSEGRGALHKTF
jgi:hypothetical protein